MSNLLLLTKINLIGLIKSYTSTKKKSSLAIILFIALFVYLGYSIYIMADLMMAGYASLNIQYILLAQFMVITSSFILLTNIYKAGGTLFKFKDYDLLMSLPIKKSTVILSKVIILYILSLGYTMLFMIPAFIAYVMNVDVTATFYLLFIVTLAIIPMVPIVIASIIGSFISGISSSFKHKNIVNYILTIGLFLSLMYFSTKMTTMNSIDMANIGKSMVEIFNKIYPLTKLYVDIISDFNILSLLYYVLIPLLLFYVFIKTLIIFYSKINDSLSSYKKNENYKLSKLEKGSPLMALYKKELKRYVSSVNYVMNTAIGSIMLTICIIGFVIFGGDKVNALLGMPGFSDVLLKTGPLVIGAFCLLNCTTSSSISLEGKNLWIIKSIPVNVKEIFYSKIMVNLTVLIPAVLINSAVFSIYLKTNFVMTLFMFVTPIIYSLFVSILGIVINVMFPNFTWENEIKVIKQSLASFLAIMIGMAIAIVPLSISYSFSGELYVLLITSIMILITLALYIYMNKYSVKAFNKLG